MAKFITLEGQHSERQPTTLVIQAITWWEAGLAHVKLQESGLGVHLPVKVFVVITHSGALRTGSRASEAGKV